MTDFYGVHYSKLFTCCKNLIQFILKVLTLDFISELGHDRWDDGHDGGCGVRAQARHDERRARL